MPLEGADRLVASTGRLDLFADELGRAVKPFPQRISTDPERLEKGLAQLVLTLVELLRQIMERQALRRAGDGTLTDAEIDRLGETFMLLERRMEELKEVFGLTDADLNLNLGPLGSLV